MPKRTFFIIHLVIFAIISLFSYNPWPDLLLVSAQIMCIPILFQATLADGSIFKRIYPYMAIPAYLAVAVITIVPYPTTHPYAAIMYGIFTLYMAIYGITRFIQRGFTHIEEFAIDCGWSFLFVGGLWYMAYHMGVDTGFSPLLTWLTAVHFHYSSTIMLIFIGLLGRLQPTKAYKAMTIAMIILPWIMAAGITYSRWVELIGIIAYIMSIYTLIYRSIKTSYKHPYQRIATMTSFATVGITIILACSYILSTGFGMTWMTIETMLITHGIMNAILFGLVGTTGWIIAIPNPSYKHPTFLLSPIRRKFLPAQDSLPLSGLVDDLSIYVPANQRSEMTDGIKDFYEHTGTYRLQANIHWARVFLPFACVYKVWSSLVEQINLPLSRKRVEMTGDILHVDEGEHGRNAVRAWVRKIAGKLVFVALYSSHQTKERTYMNIALPLPLTSMHGILACQMTAEGLELTSVRKNETMTDAGIYLAIGKNGYFRLPLTETFFVREVDKTLIATHDMEIFGFPFLHIDYHIEKRHQTA